MWECISWDGKKEAELLVGEKWAKTTETQKRLESMDKLVVKVPEEKVR